MSPQLVSTIITISFIAIAALGFLRGFFKGTIKSVIDVAFVLVSAVASIFLTNTITNLIINPQSINSLLEYVKQYIYVENLYEYIELAQGYITSSQNAGDLLSLLVAVPTIVIMPLVYLIIFGAVSLILFIPKKIMEILLFTKPKGVATKLGGGAIGAVRYALTLVFVLIPIIGYVNVGANVMETYYADLESETALLTETAPDLEDENIGDGEDEGEYTPAETKTTGQIVLEYLNSIRNNPVAKVIYNVGGNGIFNSMSQTKISGVDITLQNEAYGVVKLYNASLPFMGAAPADYGEEQIEALDNINLVLEDSEFLPLLLSKLISFTSGEFLENGECVGIQKPTLGQTFDPTVDRVLAVLANTDSDGLRADLITISGIGKMAIREGVIVELMSEERDILGLIKREEVISPILHELYANERTRGAIPYISNALNNYVCRLYDEVNGTSTRPEEFDYSRYNEAAVDSEAGQILKIVDELHQFIASTEGKEDIQDVIVNADLEPLGNGMEHARESIILGRAYKVFFYAFLHSEGCDEYGIIDQVFIDNATAEDADISTMLVARQDVAKLILSMQSIGTDGSKEELLHSVVNSMLSNDSESIKAIVTPENLVSLGISSKNAGSINGIINSMMNSAENQEYETEEQKQEEIKKTEEMLNAMSGAMFNSDADNMFTTSSTNAGKTSMTAEDFVDSVMDSSIVSGMVEDAAVDENGETAQDPYKLQSKMSATDKVNLANAIEEKYNSEDITEEQKATLEALASVFGVSIN
ncbi:MAG: CvpA family protein [Clostridia bacterium]|nr:CvpA family protein [Clostridia bacterium]